MPMRTRINSTTGDSWKAGRRKNTLKGNPDCYDGGSTFKKDKHEKIVCVTEREMAKRQSRREIGGRGQGSFRV